MKKILMTSKLFDMGFNFLKDKVEMIQAFSDDIREAVAANKDVDAIFLGNQKLDASLIDEMENLCLIAKQGSGYDNIDVDHATRKGIPVVISAGVNAQAVAEHVMLMMLAASRNLHKYDQGVRNGLYSLRSTCQQKECFGKTLGLIGLGRIGQAVSKYAQAFGMKTIAYDPYLKSANGIVFCSSLEELLRQSDVVSIHVPLTDKTRKLIGKSELELMKPDSIIINCARGGIVDEKALYEELANGHLWAAGLDVYEIEPAIKNNPLFSLDNVIVTPHCAALTKESSDSMSYATAKGMLAVLNGEKWDCVANPQVYRR